MLLLVPGQTGSSHWLFMSFKVFGIQMPKAQLIDLI